MGAGCGLLLSFCLVGAGQTADCGGFVGLIVEIWQVRKKKREVYLTPVERRIISTAGAVVLLAALAAAAFWLWPFSLEQWGAAGAAVYVAYKWGEAVGTRREQLLQDE